MTRRSRSVVAQIAWRQHAAVLRRRRFTITQGVSSPPANCVMSLAVGLWSLDLGEDLGPEFAAGRLDHLLLSGSRRRFETR